MLNPKDRFPRAVLDDEKREFFMKRAFIRLFGCVLSAIGLSMSYDTTFSVLLGDESAPGALWASGTGSGSGCLYKDGCYPYVPSGFLVSGVSGSCSYDRMNVGYNVLLVPWYVGWLNPSYSTEGSRLDLRAEWPVAGSVDVEMNLQFSGTSDIYVMSGMFGATNIGARRYDSNTQQYYWPTPDLCTGNYGVSLGMATGVGEGPGNLSFRNMCVLNLNEGFSDLNYYDYVYTAVYLPSAVPFNSFGCCLYKDGDASDTSCPCYYAQASKSYDYKAYNSDTSAYEAKETVPFYEPFILYYYNGCKNGYYQNALFTGTDANFAISLMAYTTPTLCGDVANGNPCPTDLDDSIMGMVHTEVTDVLYKNFWDNCDACPTMQSIENASSFIPTITDLGTVTALSSDAGETGAAACNVSVKGAKNSKGTLNIVDPCSY